MFAVKVLLIISHHKRMNFLIIILLALIDLNSLSAIMLTAHCQFSLIFLIHVNYYLISILNVFLSRLLYNIFIITIFCFYLYYYEWALIFEFYLNIMIYSLIASVPLFIFYVNYNKTLQNNSNIKMLSLIFKIFT